MKKNLYLFKPTKIKQNDKIYLIRTDTIYLKLLFFQIIRVFFLYFIINKTHPKFKS